MTVGIYTNIYKDNGLEITKNLIQQLNSSNVDFYLYENLANFFPLEKTFNELGKTLFDCIITIGGDGTILRIAKWCAKKSFPMLGINMGKVGFLTEVEKGNLGNLIAEIGRKNYQIESRALLCANFDGNIFYALNEFVVSRSNHGKMIIVEVFIGNQMVDSYYCDGYIVSTPTGSTAYSLSAGGPVISPRAKALALTPINSHSLHSRPIIISDDETVEVRLSKNTAEASVIVDGVECGIIKSGEKLSVKKAELSVQFIRFKDNNFFSKLLDKLNTWSVTPEGDR